MVSGRLWEHDGVDYYRIDDATALEPFLMAVVSDCDLWMFVSSTGALTAGRGDADHAIFAYETDDRLHRLAGWSGPVTLIARNSEAGRQVWAPFDRSTGDQGRLAIAKAVHSNRLMFEAAEDDWGITVRATWTPAGRLGWVRSVEVLNETDAPVEFEVLDGLVDVMPAGVDALTEQVRSNLVDAYKRSELAPDTRPGVFTLESGITDRAEPSEALTATVAWPVGFAEASVGLDRAGVEAMKLGVPEPITRVVTGTAGAYLLRGRVALAASASAEWSIAIDTNLDHADVAAAQALSLAPNVAEQVADAIRAGDARLRRNIAETDGVQSTPDPIADEHHRSNVLFNAMRGGLFPHGYSVTVDDLVAFVKVHNRPVAQTHADWFASLGPSIAVAELRRRALVVEDADLVRLVLEYLPLAFARRHGDPSRPWNRFSIAPDQSDGSLALSYEGNWRDIFQNWEALLVSYPEYYPNVVAKFLNASTIDGYNPYRITREGVDWEIPDPEDPWSHIGYWGDHQIVYLLRLLQAWERADPGAVGRALQARIHVFADVPYTLAAHHEMIEDPRDTISYDVERARRISEREAHIGSDGRLLAHSDGSLVRATMLEKLLVPAMAKLSCLVPDAGIWLNTQRPEWNDANNALAGPGVSTVTLCHLVPYLRFVRELLEEHGPDSTELSPILVEWMQSLDQVAAGLEGSERPLDDRVRRRFVDAAGLAGERYRARALDHAQAAIAVDLSAICAMIYRSERVLAPMVQQARRDDGLYHSYARVSFPAPDRAVIDHLGPMLEGQVAALSSGTLDGAQTLGVIDALFASAMYRADQQSFMLYPARLPKAFVDRNDVVGSLGGVSDDDRALFDRYPTVFSTDTERVHFRSALINDAALTDELTAIEVPGPDRQRIRQIYEQVFDHGSFTGRSQGMYGYEGLGSIYWHMVAKLQLAIQESYWRSVDAADSDEIVAGLAQAYRRVRDGLGFRKTPAAFGAIPIDCYSHTPAHAGAKQPGMTGQVKEAIICRFGELGLRVVDGELRLMPGLLPPHEVLPASLSFCGVPMTIRRGSSDTVAVTDADRGRQTPGLTLDRSTTRSVFARSGAVTRIDWTVGEATASAWS